MDMDQYAGGVQPYAGFFGPGLFVEGVEGASRQDYEDLTETQREHLLLKCKDAKTADEMQRIVDEALPGVDARAVAQAEAEEKNVSTNRRLR